MAPPLCVQPLVQTGPLGCGVTALAMYLGCSSVAELRTRLGVSERQTASWGARLTGEQIRRLARRAHVLFTGQRPPDDLSEMTGLLLVKPDPRGFGTGYHWVVLVSGAVVNPRDGCVYDRESYLAQRRPFYLLTEAPHPEEVE